MKKITILIAVLAVLTACAEKDPNAAFSTPQTVAEIKAVIAETLPLQDRRIAENLGFDQEKLKAVIAPLAARCEAMINANSKNLQAYVCAGEVYGVFAPFLAESFNNYSKALNYNPVTNEDLFAHAVASVKTGNLAAALADLKKLGAATPEDSRIYALMAELNIARNNNKGALANMTKAISFAPENSYYYAKRGDLNVDVELFSAALVDYEKALSLNPDMTSVYIKTRTLYNKLGDEYRANEVSKKLSARFPKNEVFKGMIRKGGIFGLPGQKTPAVLTASPAKRAPAPKAAAKKPAAKAPAKK